MSELGALKKINPVVVVLTLALMVLGNSALWDSSLPVEQRALVFGLSLALVLVAVGFEAHRIARQEDLEKDALRRKLFGG